MSGMKITRDYLDTVLASVRTMDKKRVLVGIPAPEDKRQSETIGNAALGYIHENGSTAQNIPARPFLVPGVKAVQKDTIKTLRDSAKQVLKGNPQAVEKGLNIVGLEAQASVKQTLKAGEGFEPLSESTLEARRRKGFKGEKPLIRTGQLLNSITYVVRES